MRKTGTLAVLAAMGSLIIFGWSALAQSQTMPQEQGAGVTYDVASDVAAKASHPTPGPEAKQQSQQATIGDGKVTVQTSRANSFWVEEIDLDGSGKPVESQLMWDDDNKILYTYAEKSFTCADGSSESGDFLIAMYGKGNPAKKPGSGWWAANLNQGQCETQNDELYGCRFDSKGENTTCGVANLNEKTNELTITVTTTKRQ